VRFAVFFLAVALLAGCGISNASSSPPTPTPLPLPSLPTPPYHQAPPMTINTGHRYTATLVTNRGTVTIALLARAAPVAVNNFVFLARHHYYDNNLFFRVIRGFMIQTGDPTGTGMGGPGYQFNDERVNLPYNPGITAMANSGPNTNGSQFFIVAGPQGRSLPHSYTIFGRVTGGMTVVDAIAATPTTANPLDPSEISQPLTQIVLKRVTIHEMR
jgi:peptidylprolyl isomerase